MPEESLAYRTATTILRPPRVAVLFYGGTSWQAWARLALEAVSVRWGGGGYILVPYGEDGVVHPTIINTVRTYDPDELAILIHDVATWHRLSPDVVGPRPDEDPCAWEARLAAAADEPVADAWAKKATESLAAVVTPLAHSRLTPHPLRISVGGSNGGDWHHRVDENSVIGTRSVVGATTEWDGDVALWALAKTGSPPHSEPTRPAPADEDLLDWLLDPSAGEAPEPLIWQHSRESTSEIRADTWFEAASPTLTRISTGWNPVKRVLVLGDTAEDFALALALDRILGFAIWLSNDATSVMDAAPRLKLHLHGVLGFDASDVHVTTVSKTPADAQDALNSMTIRGQLLINDVEVTSGSSSLGVSKALPEFGSGLSTLAIADGVGASYVVPVFESPDGTVRLAAPFEAPLPPGPESGLPLDQNGQPAWVVDVQISPRSMPPGRQLPAAEIVASENLATATLLRNARDGITFRAASFGFVAGNSVLHSRLARPHLRQLGLYSWVQAMARRHNLNATYSKAGQYSELVARRLGGRVRLVELAAGGQQAAFSEFRSAASPKKSSDAFPCGDGVLLGLSPYLTFAAFRRVLGSISDAPIRALLDELLRARLLRRGLVLGCEECGSPSFVSIDDLAQVYECSHCGARNDFIGAQWRRPMDEPVWHYDLHKAFRGLVDEHGMEVLRAAARVGGATDAALTTSEVVFTDADGKPMYEIDLIAFVNGQVTVGEVKSSGNMGSGAALRTAVKKRLDAAEILQADEVLFATAGAWPPSARAAIDKSIRVRPEVRVRFEENL
ncbi:hypothetical protein J2X63_000735 [Agromyces sp. 3263]|uniref:hypothetical protein n=1 Tax=Agromyces sp. 3263 TaxID=2817750 RepID=UPI0028660E47|nr:hypothetical protein [Agromyces sp. 3263]MDR6905049.1 hypothetical protein [Agromyces sp. 3263]